MADRPGGWLPLAGTGLTVPAYADFLAKEYLGDYLRSGGAAVRFVVCGDAAVADRWHAALARAAEAEGYLRVGVSAADTRVHLVDQIWLALARAVSWPTLADRALAAAWTAADLPPAPTGDLTVAAVAAHHGVDAGEAARSVRRRLEHAILHQARLAREFRLALLRLCQAQLGTGEVTESERDAVLAWLRGEPVSLRALRSASLFSRIGRHNARAMLVSLAGWQASTTGTGFVLDLDLQRLAETHRPPPEQRTGHYYTRAAVLDAYEVLRQLIDATDQLRGVLVAVTLPVALLTDEQRGLPAYSALHLRVVDEVRDRRRANPYAALVRLETRMEAVP
ncbi:MAG: BREX system ATP-binding domain-containing protein [Actinomycetota bacterium]